MKKIIPFSKDIEFNTSIFEITSISLEHNLKVDKGNNINGEFIISGEYKESDNVIKSEPFIFNIPYDMDLDNTYEDDIKIEIDNFNYELIENILKVNISLSLDLPNIKEDIEIIDDVIEEIDNDIREETLFKEITEVKPVINDSSNEVVNSLFNNINTEEAYVNYHVHIYREKDNVNDILKTYNITKEELEEYNDISSITIGSKLIIPSNE